MPAAAVVPSALVDYGRFCTRAFGSAAFPPFFLAVVNYHDVVVKDAAIRTVASRRDAGVRFLRLQPVGLDKPPPTVCDSMPAVIFPAAERNERLFVSRYQIIPVADRNTTV